MPGMWHQLHLQQCLQRGDMDFTADPRGALDLLERWKYIFLWCGKEITEAMAGNWQTEINYGGNNTTM